MSKSIFFMILLLSTISYSQEYFFFFDRGDCVAGNYANNYMWLDVEHKVDIDFDSPTPLPDSVLIYDKTGPLPVVGRMMISTTPKVLEPYKLSANIYVGDTIYKLDSTFLVARIPDVQVKLTQMNHNIQLQIMEDSVNVSDQYNYCFTECQFYYPNDSMKVFWGFGRDLDLNDIEDLNKDDGIKIESGDKGKILFVRLWSKVYNRDFFLKPDLEFVIK